MRSKSLLSKKCATCRNSEALPWRPFIST